MTLKRRLIEITATAAVVAGVITMCGLAMIAGAQLQRLQLWPW